MPLDSNIVALLDFQPGPGVFNFSKSSDIIALARFQSVHWLIWRTTSSTCAYIFSVRNHVQNDNQVLRIYGNTMVRHRNYLLIFQSQVIIDNHLVRPLCHKLTINPINPMSHGSSAAPVRLERIGNTVLAALRAVLYTPGSRRDEMKSRHDEIKSSWQDIMSSWRDIMSSWRDIKSSRRDEVVTTRYYVVTTRY